MSDVLPVSAAELRHPVALRVSLKSGDGALHAPQVRLSPAPVKGSLGESHRVTICLCENTGDFGKNMAESTMPIGEQPSSAHRAHSASRSARFRRLLWHRSEVGGDVALLALRVGFGLALALAHGYGKLTNPERFLHGLAMNQFPLPGLFGWAAIGSEFLGGLLLALGFFTRPAAALVLVTMGVAAFDIHAEDPFAKRELALAYAVVAFALLLAGPGRFALDRRWFRS